MAVGMLSGKRALVTGGARGIGKAIAEEFLAAGCAVVTVDVNPGQLDVPHLVFDLARIDELPGLVARAEAAIGPLDILVNCAAIPSSQPLAELTPEHFHQVLTVNLAAPVFLTKAVAVGMAERGYGRIVNIASVHGMASWARNLSYDTSKAGLLGMTRTAAVELIDDGILVNAVAPGWIDTSDGADEASERFRVVYQQYGRLPARRQGEPAEIARLVCWLASSANSYMTGTCVTADGGLLATF